MLPLLKPYLHQKGDPSAEDCRAALGVVENELAAVRGRLGALQEKRAAGIIDGVEFKLLDAIDTDLRRAGIEQERLEIAGTELGKMIEQATARERAAQADAILRQAATMKSRGLDLFDTYASHAARLVETLQELQQAEHAIAAANAALASLGDPRSVQSIEASYWHEAIVQFPPWSLLAQVRLPDPEVSRRLLWPRGELS